MEVIPFNNGYGAICLIDGCNIIDNTFTLLPESFKALGENYGSYFPASRDRIRWGMYDIITNNWVIQPTYGEVTILNEEYISCSKLGMYGILDFQGKQVVPFISDYEIVLDDNVALLTSKEGLKGAFCFNTRKILSMKYQKIISDETGNLFLCKKDGKWSVLNAKGQLIQENIQGVSQFPMIKQGRMKLQDENGNVGFILFE